MQRERSHTVPPGSRSPEFRVPVWQRMAEIVQLRGLEAVGSHCGDERPYEIDGSCAVLTRRPWADSVVHQYDGFRGDLASNADEHLIRRVSPPVLRVRGPAHEHEPVSMRHLFGRWCDEAPRGPPVPHRLPERREARRNVRFDPPWRHGVVAGVLVTVKGDVVSILLHAGYEGRVSRGSRRDDEERGACAGFGEGVDHARGPDGVWSVVEGDGHGCRGQVVGAHLFSCCPRPVGTRGRSRVRLLGVGVGRCSAP